MLVKMWRHSGTGITTSTLHKELMISVKLKMPLCSSPATLSLGMLHRETLAFAQWDWTRQGHTWPCCGQWHYLNAYPEGTATDPRKSSRVSHMMQHDNTAKINEVESSVWPSSFLHVKQKNRSGIMMHRLHSVIYKENKICKNHNTYYVDLNMSDNTVLKFHRMMNLA